MPTALFFPSRSQILAEQPSSLIVELVVTSAALGKLASEGLPTEQNLTASALKDLLVERMPASGDLRTHSSIQALFGPASNISTASLRTVRGRASRPTDLRRRRMCMRYT
jgi:hypothetical protein